jgi:histidinol-phosphate phosphatase family protein
MISTVFLDRDGTIIEDTGYPRDPKLVTLIPGAIEGMRVMRKKDYALFMVSNQSGVARGIIGKEQFEQVHHRVMELLRQNDIVLDGFAYCFHHPDDGCPCRKPKTGLLPKEIKGRKVHIEKSYVAGDRESDVGFATAAGLQPILVLTGAGTNTHNTLYRNNCPDRVWICDSLVEAASRLL